MFQRPLGTAGEADLAEIPATAFLDGDQALAATQSACGLDDRALSKAASFQLRISSCGPGACMISSNNTK